MEEGTGVSLVDAAMLRFTLSLVKAYAVSLGEKHVARCQTLEEEHMDQAIEQEVCVHVSVSIKYMIYGATECSTYSPVSFVGRFLL